MKIRTIAALAVLSLSATASAAPGVVAVDVGTDHQLVDISYDSAGVFSVVTTDGDDEVWIIDAGWDFDGEASSCDDPDVYQTLIVRIDGGDFHTWQLCDAAGVVVELLDGDDYLEAYFADALIEADGGDGDDEMEGSANGDILSGGRGADEILGRGGDDIIRGNRGEDDITGGDGDDDIHGGRGADTISGGSGADVIAGGRGTDTVSGGSGDDVLYAQTTSQCGDGSDSLDGGSGSNTIDPNCP